MQPVDGFDFAHFLCCYYHTTTTVVSVVLLLQLCAVEAIYTFFLHSCALFSRHCCCYTCAAALRKLYCTSTHALFFLRFFYFSGSGGMDICSTPSSLLPLSWDTLIRLTRLSARTDRAKRVLLISYISYVRYYRYSVVYVLFVLYSYCRILVRV